MPICFDLDGTLGTFGWGYVLLRQALGELWGQEPSAEELMACTGSTDWEIVDELHRARFGLPLTPEGYEAYDQICLAHFRAAYHPHGKSPVAFLGILEGMARLAQTDQEVWLVSGNTPAVLAFKAEALGVEPAIPRQGSIPHHDRDAARAAGIPFLGIGEAVPGEHPLLSIQAEADHLVEAVDRILQGS